MRQVKLTGREASVVRAIGFAESMLGADIRITCGWNRKMLPTRLIA